MSRLTLFEFLFRVLRREMSICFRVSFQAICCIDFVDFVSKIGCLGLLKQDFRIENIAKNNCSQKSFVTIPESIRSCFSKALGCVFLIFVALETRLKIDTFSARIWLKHVWGVGAKSR